MDKYIGRLLDNRYEILEVIGTGGMAVVYKARCHRLNRLVAIKILKDDYLEDEDFRRRFHAESQAVAMLSHPNIVSVYDVSTSIMADYIVMELIEGITLKQYMEKKGVLNWKETLHFAIQIAKALEHAHSRGIVHRDIKPHNVMVLKNGSVKVADFGIARVMSKGNTLTKEALGSVHYISPEQAKGGRVDSRSDIYSLGVVMYEMMSGRPPYDGDSPVAVAIQHINGGAVMPSTLNPNIPGGLEQIIMKAMAHEIGDRYSSATQMLSDMDEFRKDPTILFDYNTPLLDEVTKLQKPPLVLQTPRSTAERVASGAEGQRRRTQGGTVARNGDDRRSERAQAARRRQREEMEEESRSRVATIAIIACSLVAVIAIVVFMITLLGGGVGQKEERVEVPKLIGEVFAELPEYSDLDIIREEVYDEVVAAGTIIAQEPKAGDRVVKGTLVVVTVSKGPTPQVIKMENLIDLTEQRAREILDTLRLNLQIEVTEEYSDETAQGNVIRTEPQKDTELTSGQKVTLYVSKGKEIKTGAMPNVIGYKQETAIKTLENQKLDLKVSIEEVFDSETAAGKVVRTEPAKGEELKTDQAVKLYISKGPELGKMPNVVGADIRTAVKLLETAGFDFPSIEYVESNEPMDTVISQSHEKNVEIDVNTEIILEVSKGSKETDPPETTSPDPEVTRNVTFFLPEDYMFDYTLEVRLNNQVVTRVAVNAGSTSVTVPLTGSGKQTYELWIAGAKYSSQEVDFTANG